MKKLLLLGLVCSCLLTACVDSQQTAQKELLVGSWIFESGTKNGQLEGTELLRNLVFDFTEKTIKCEILPEMGLNNQEVDYELKDNVIMVGKQLPMTIKELTADALSLQFEIELGGNPVNFDLNFKRQ